MRFVCGGRVFVRLVALDDWNLVLAAEPAAKVDQLAPLAAEGEVRPGGAGFARMLVSTRLIDLFLAARTEHTVSCSWISAPPWPRVWTQLWWRAWTRIWTQPSAPRRRCWSPRAWLRRYLTRHPTRPSRHWRP